MSRSFRTSLTLACSTLAVWASVAHGQAPPSVQLQPRTPGITQNGHAHISGTMIAGRFVGDGSRVVNVDAVTLGGIPSWEVLLNDVPGVMYSNLPGAVLEVDGTSPTLSSTAVFGVSTSPGGWAIVGDCRNGTGASAGYGVVGRSSSSSGAGVYGFNLQSGGVGVWGGLGNNVGVVGSAMHGYSGMIGQSTNGTGAGVEGDADAGIGVSGVSTTGYGVYGRSTNGTTAAIYCDGDFVATGVKSFLIDHPLDPANRTLRHFCSEGAEPLNVYSGNVVTDAEGFATVALPDWFESVNRDFRYQLTVVDDGERVDFVSVKVVQKVVKNAFRLRTSVPNVEVSWQVTGVRNDAWVQKHPPVVEEAKAPSRRGRYLVPELFGVARETSSNPLPTPVESERSPSDRSR